MEIRYNRIKTVTTVLLLLVSLTNIFPLTAVANNAPPFNGAILRVILASDGSDSRRAIVDVASNFSDGSRRLTYTAVSANNNVATATMSGSVVTITAVASGTTTVAVTARNATGLTTTQLIDVRVHPSDNAPMTLGTFASIMLPVNGRAANIDVSSITTGNRYLIFDSYSASILNVRSASYSIIINPKTTGETTIRLRDSQDVRGKISVKVLPANRAPVAEGTISPVRLHVGDSNTYFDISSKFSDPDENPLSYSAVSNDETKVTVSVSGVEVTITAVAPGAVTVTVRASDGSLTGTQTIDVTVPNRPPERVGNIGSVSAHVGGSEARVDVSSHFRDPDKQALTYTAQSSDETKATVSVSSDTVTITAVAPGATTVTVTASDGSLNATQTIDVTVPNRAPEPQGNISPVRLYIGGSATNVDISSKFRDLDNQALTYTVESTDTAVATASVSGATVTITPKALGTASVTVTASDGSLNARQTIAVEVPNRAPERVGDIGSATLHVGGSNTYSNISSYFRDLDNQALTYTALSSDETKVTASVSSASVTITAVAPGRASVTVTASDGSLNAEQIIDVTVPNRAPERVGAILPLTLTAGGSAATVDVSSYFSDPDNDTLSYTAKSSDTSKATAAVSSDNGDTVTITPKASLGTATVTVTASDGSGLTATQTIEVTVNAIPNRAPVAQGTIPSVRLHVGDSADVNASSHFSDPDNDTLTYTARSSDPAKATVTVLSAIVTVTAVAPGSATVTVTARDNRGLTADQTIAVEVPNRAPERVGAILPLTLTTGGSAARVDVSSKFRDLDNQALTYAAKSSDNSKASAAVSSDTVTITPKALGTATVTVTASDGSLTATQTIGVFVTAAPNRPPERVGNILPLTLTAGGSAATVEVSSHFSDPDNDTLTYTARSSDNSKATVNATGSTVIISPVGSGIATVTVTARDGKGLTVTQNIVVTVNTVPNGAPVAAGAIFPVTLTAGDSPINVDVSSYFSDPDNDTLTYDAQSSNINVASVNMFGSTVSITPVGAGQATVTVTANDGSQNARQTITVTINEDTEADTEEDTEQAPQPNRPPVAVGTVAPLTLTAGDSAQTVNLSTYFSDPDGDRLNYTVLSADTAKATVNVAGDIITITPVAEGTTTITVMAQDPAGLTTTQVIVASVSAAPNRAPERTGTIAPVSLTAGDTPITVDVSLYFSDSDPLTYTVLSNDNRVATVAASNHILLITPVAEGTTTILVMARDIEGLTISQTIIVTVEAAPNRVPTTVGTIAPVRLTAGDSSIAVDVSPYFSDPDNDPLTYTAVSNDPRVVTVTASNTTLIITPVANGTTTITVTVSDGKRTATQNIAVVVEAAPNRAPVAVEAIPSVMFIAGDSAKTMSVSLYFSDPDNDELTYTAVSNDPGVVTVAVSETTLTITPVAVGATSVTVTASDGKRTATQNIATLVVQSNRAPVSVGTIAPVTLTLKDSATSLELADYFLDPADDPLTYSAQSSDTQVVTVNVVNSTIMMSPIAEGVTNIVVTARDSEGLTAFQTIDITVVPVPNRAPVPIGLIDPITLVANDSATAIDISGYFSDPDNDLLIYSAVSTHTRVATVNVSDITLTITPVTAGTATVIIIVQDAKGLTATRNVTVMVNPAPNRAPAVEQAISPVTLVANEGATAIDISGYFSDPDNDPLTYTAVSTSPSIATAEMIQSTLSIRPIAEGTSSVMLTASDSQLNITQTVTVTVELAPNRAPVTVGRIAPVTLTAGEGATTIDISGYFSDPDNDLLAYTAVSTSPSIATAEMIQSTLSIRPIAEGSITIMVVVQDTEGLTVTQHIPVTVNRAPNRAPVTVGVIDPITLTLRDSDYTVNLSPHFSDPDNDLLTYTAVSNDATKATVSMSSADLTITPMLEGIIEVTVIVQDTAGLTVTQRIPVTVNRAPNRAPVAVGDIDSVSLIVGEDEQTVDVSSHFSDPDGDALTYSAQSGDETVATVVTEGATVVVRPVAEGITTVTIAVQDAEAAPVTRDFSVIVNTTPNTAPTFASAALFTVAENNRRVGAVTASDTDDEDSVTQYTVTGGVDRAMFSINPLSGELSFNVAPDFETPNDTSKTNRYIVLVQAQSGSGTRVLTAEQTIIVTVTDENDAPVAVGEIDPVTLIVGEDGQTVDVSSHFSDPDGDALTYSARSGDVAVAKVIVEGSTLTLSAVETGRTQVTVTALDVAGLTATQPIAVTVDVVVKQAPSIGLLKLDATLSAVVDSTSLMQLSPDSAVANGDRLRLSVDVGRTGLAVTADISDLDTTQSRIALTPDTNGIYSAEISISEHNTALNGVKRVLVTATDAMGNSTQLIVTSSLNNRYTTALLPNFPNPFNPETWIPYHLGTDADVVMNIYDARGDMVRQFHLGFQPAGTYETRSRAVYWDGTNDFGQTVATGVYFYTLTTNDYSQTRKATILK